ncbi:ABC transporter substrate-binding protein [Geodermatophilus sp. URMC 64]
MTAHRSLRLAVLVLAAALPLAACGGTSGEEPAAGSPPAADGAFPRTVEHAMGSTEIAEQPVRVVVLDTGELDSALALGVTPVGAVTTDVSSGFLSYLAEDAADVEQVGTIGEPNLEAIAALRPDLILSNEVRHEELYDELSAIAPTVFAEQVGAVWKDNLLLAAEALGLEDEAEAALADYEQEAAGLGERLGEPLPTVSPVRFVQGTVRAYRPESFLGTVLADVGLPQPELPAGEVPQFAELSPEELSLADADVVLYSSFGDTVDSGQKAVVGGPLWPRLSAVEAGRAYQVEDDVFFTGIGLTAATLILDDLADLLAP